MGYHPVMRSRHVVATFATLLLSASVLAQSTSWHVGVIVSSSGPAAATGRLQAHAAARFVATVGARGVFGTPLEVEVRDDAGDPARAAGLARDLLDAGAAALVCCTTPLATARVRDVAEAAGVPLLALTDVALDATFWSFALAPSDAAVLTAVVQDAGGAARLALMTLDTPFGDAARTALETALAAVGGTLVGEARYPAMASVLTPEGLWIASRQPDAVVVWGLPSDLPVALDGLRQRGYEGPVYARAEALPPAVLDRTVAMNRPVPASADDVWTGVRTALVPAAVADRLPPSDPRHAAAASFLERSLDGDAGAATVAERSVLALVDDALSWLVAGMEQVAALGLDDGPATRRQALRDALIGLPAHDVASGIFDATEQNRHALGWLGFVVVEVAPLAR